MQGIIGQEARSLLIAPSHYIKGKGRKEHRQNLLLVLLYESTCFQNLLPWKQM